MSSYFPNRWPLSYLNLTKNIKNIHKAPTAQNIKHQKIRLFIILIFGVVWLEFFQVMHFFKLGGMQMCNTNANPPYKLNIRKTCPCSEYPLKPHFYIVKLGFAGVYLFFLFLLQNIDCGYTLEPPHRGGSNKYPQSMF